MSFKLNKLKNKNKESGTPSPSGSFGDAEYQRVIDGIKRVYKSKIKPLEVTYNFEGFHSAPLTDSDIEAKPIVLLLGQYSTGKTTFIRHLLDKAYPGEHIGVEPTTDRFVAVMHGDEDRVIPGNAAAVNQELPFRGLNKFGQAFLSRFQVSQTNSPVLENMTLIDTPGILAGDKQSMERGYDFTQVIEWYAERADLILLMFDSHKLDISNEFRMAIQALRGKEEKVRVILNKSDMVSQQQLMRVYGAMMWSLGKVIQTPEVVRVYISSFWVDRPPNCFEDCRQLIEMESKDLLHDLKELRRNAAVRKINDIVKRARLAKVHALIISHLKKEMPAMFGKKKKQGALLNNLGQEFAKIQQKYHLPVGDFPNPERFRQNLTNYDLDKFKNLKEDLIEKVDEATSHDFPNLLTQLPASNPELDQQERNPFDNQTSQTQNFWDYNAIDKSTYQHQFNQLNPRQGKLSGAVIKPVLMNTGLPNDQLAHIWRLSDYDNDGYMDVDEFSIAMHLIKAVNLNMLPLPEKLPPSLMPNRKL